MKKYLLILILLPFLAGFAVSAANDRRISDNDGDVLNINSDGTLPISFGGGAGDITIDGGIYTEAGIGIGTTNLDSGAKLEVDGNVYPTVDNAYDLGSTALRWNDGYFGGNLTVDGTAYYTGATSQISGNTTISITPGISIGGTGNSGFGTSAPSAMLDVGGATRGFVDGTNDLLVKDAVEVDGKIYPATDVGIYWDSASSTRGFMGIIRMGGVCHSMYMSSANTVFGITQTCN